jgi:hypothetical protein
VTLFFATGAVTASAPLDATITFFPKESLRPPDCEDLDGYPIECDRCPAIGLNRRDPAGITHHGGV